MKVLFVSSGKMGDVGHVVRNQGESLKREGIEVDYFIVSPRLTGYVKSVLRLRETVKRNSYDLIHAHYSLSAYVASFVPDHPLVVSLMGSDAFQNFILRWLTGILSCMRWKATIVKTEEMKNRLKLSKAVILPNGVDTDRFVPLEREASRMRLGLMSEDKVILFISVNNRPEKNLDLAIRAVESLDDSGVRFIHLHDTPNAEIPYYLSAADLLLLTSEREGGVNVIKEAMACNCPIVATDVGDVRQVINGTEGCYVTGPGIDSITDNLKRALEFRGRTDGRARIFSLGLDSVSVAQKLCKIYKTAASRS